MNRIPRVKTLTERFASLPMQPGALIWPPLAVDLYKVHASRHFVYLQIAPR